MSTRSQPAHRRRSDVGGRARAGVIAASLSRALAPPLPEPEPTAAPALALDLEWNAPVQCPAGDAVQRSIAALLARRVDLDPTGSLHVRADVRATAEGFAVELALDDDSRAEQRTLHAPRCDALADAVALVVATSVDPRQVATTLAAAREDPAPVVSMPEPPAVAAAHASAPIDRERATTPAPAPAPARPRLRMHAELGVAGGLALGLTPKPAGWLQGDVLWVLGPGAIGAHAGHAFARTGDGDPSARVRTTQFGLRGCWVPRRGALAVPLCAVAELGAMVASGRGAGVAVSTQSSLWVGAGLGARVQWWPHPRVALFAGLDALATARRPRFHVAAAAEIVPVFEAAPVAVRLLGGAAVRFGGIARPRR
ncbi:MAG: hypothetical protein K1X88_23915 [Nannocystaceae bacterium]|nr:hypothetical protein [Nannocystaceae bacterium]